VEERTAANHVPRAGNEVEEARLVVTERRTFRPVGAAALGLGALLLAGTAPAQARDRISDRDIDRARDACREIARDRDWREIETDVRDRDDDRGRVIVRVTGRRDGEDRERRCTYDVRDDRAELEEQDRDRDYHHGGDRDVERARDACRQVAENRDWRNVSTDVVDRERNGRVVLEVHGRRHGDQRDRECRYDVRRDSAEFDDQD
jgi:hypothetical protein